MIPPTSPRSTAYKEFVFSNLPQRMAVGQGLYNYHELADLLGLKATNNFRRRVKELVASGKIDAIAVFTPRGGIEARFQLPIQFIAEEGGDPSW